MHRFLLYLVILLAGFDPWGSVARAADVAVEQPWARATPGRAPTGAVYLTVANRGSEPDRLLGVSTPAAAKAELHATQASGQVMEMRAINEVVLKPGETLTLRPDGFHVMLMGLKAPLKEGERFPITLRFARAGEITVEVAIGKAGAMGPPR